MNELIEYMYCSTEEINMSIYFEIISRIFFVQEMY